MPSEGIPHKIEAKNLKALLAANLSRPTVVLTSALPWGGKQLDKDKGNWVEWSCYVQGALVGNSLFRYCKPNPIIPNSTTQPRAYANWQENDERVCGFLAAGCSDNEIKRLKPLEHDAARYWKLLEERHTQQGPMGQVYFMHNAMALSLEPGYISDYVEKISKVFDLLDKVWAMGSLDLDALKQVMAVNTLHLREQDQIALLDDICRGTAGGTPFTTKNIIRFAEEQQLVLNNKKDNSPNAIALATQSKLKSNNNLCSNCKKLHYSARYCIAEGGSMAGKSIKESKVARRKDCEVGKQADGNTKIKNNTIPVSFTDKEGRSYIVHVSAQDVVDAVPAPSTSYALALLATLPADFDPDLVDYKTYGFSALSATMSDVDLESLPIRCSLDWNKYTKPTAETPSISALNQTQSTPISTTNCPFYVDSGASMHLSSD